MPTQTTHQKKQPQYVFVALEETARGLSKNIQDETLVVFQKKPDLFRGHTKRVIAYDDARQIELNTGNEQKALTTTVIERLQYTFSMIQQELNIRATIDIGNRQAQADVIVDGTTILTSVPVVTLLMLEAKIKGWMTIINAAPTLESGIYWEPNESFKTHSFITKYPVTRQKTEKTLRVISLAKATDKHPEQVTTQTEDRGIGNIEETTMSGAVTSAWQSAFLTKLQKLQAAVIVARQKANSVELEEVNIAEPITKYLFS